MLSTVAIVSLPAPARIAAVAASKRRAGNRAAAGDDQDPALGFLVPVDDRRQRMRVERRSVELHRVPAMASGAEVFGAPSASSGAPWFHSSSAGTHRPLASGSNS